MTGRLAVRLRVLGIWIDVIRSEPGDWSTNGMGRENEMAGRILLRKGMPPGTELNTLLHELIHLILYIQGHNEVARDERTVSALASGLLTLLVDNPNLRQFVNAARKGQRGGRHEQH